MDSQSSGDEEDLGEASKDVQSSEDDDLSMTNKPQGLESRNPLLGTDIQGKLEATEEVQRGEEEDIDRPYGEVQTAEEDIPKVPNECQRDVQDMAEGRKDVQRQEEENLVDSNENVQIVGGDIIETIEYVHGAEEKNIGDTTKDVYRAEEDLAMASSQQGSESRNPSLRTEIQGKLDVTEELERGDEEDIPMTNSEQLKQVHQTYRKMEGDRRMYHIVTEGTMRQQQALLDNMKSENSAFKQMVDTYVIKDYQQQMGNLIEQADKLQSMVEIETRRVKELDNAIANLAAKEMDAKRAAGGFKAGWEKHKSTQIQIQITENRLEKATIDLNIVQGHTKSLQEDMEKLRREQDLYSNVYMKMEKERSAKEEETELCIEEIYDSYKETSIFQQQISELSEMYENLHNYYIWLNTEGWDIQDPVPLTELSFDLHDGSMAEKDRYLPTRYTGTKSIEIQSNGKAERKGPVVNNTTKGRRGIAGIDYKQWIEMKALEDIQDVLKIDDVQDILPSLLEASRQDAKVFENVIHLMQVTIVVFKHFNIFLACS
eukprot:Gb_18960 [translate_table: standard]